MSDDVYDWADDNDLAAFGLKIDTIPAIELQRGSILCTPQGEPGAVILRGPTLAECPDCGSGSMFIVADGWDDMTIPVEVFINPAEPVQILTGAWW